MLEELQRLTETAPRSPEKLAFQQEMSVCYGVLAVAAALLLIAVSLYCSLG